MVRTRRRAVPCVAVFMSRGLSANKTVAAETACTNQSNEQELPRGAIDLRLFTRQEEKALLLPFGPSRPLVFASEPPPLICSSASSCGSRLFYYRFVLFVSNHQTDSALERTLAAIRDDTKRLAVCFLDAWQEATIHTSANLSNTVTLTRTRLDVLFDKHIISGFQPSVMVGSTGAAEVAQAQFRALDVFIVQANTNTLLSHFCSLAASLWLLARTPKLAKLAKGGSY